MGKPARHRHTATPTTVRTILIAVASVTAIAVGTISIAVTGASSATSSRSRADAAYSSRSLDRVSRGAARTPLATPSPAASDEPEATETPQAPPVRKKHHRKVLSHGACEASYYGSGGRTASGEDFDPDALTAAHRTLPLGSKVRVINRDNDRSVVVRINDRGPFVSGRCLDLSSAAMHAVGGIGAGVIPVRYEVLSKA